MRVRLARGVFIVLCLTPFQAFGQDPPAPPAAPPAPERAVDAPQADHEAHERDDRRNSRGDRDQGDDRGQRGDRDQRRDGDQRGDRDRSRPVLDTIFRRLDVSQDGELEPAEIPAERRQMYRRLVAEADANDDRKLTREEFDAGMSKLQETFQDRLRQGTERFRGPGPRGDDGPGGRPMRPMAGLFGVLDNDHDGKISERELDTAQRSLRQLDRNGDGELTPNEFGAPGRPVRPVADRREGDRPDGEGDRGERERRDGDRERRGPGGPPDAGRGEQGERGEFRGPGGPDGPGPRGGMGPRGGFGGGGFGRPGGGPPFGFPGGGPRPGGDLPAPVEEFFNQLDRNHDGNVDREELREMFHAPGPSGRRGEGGPPPGPRTGGRRPAVEV
ncbi:MAG: hypothetical protein SGJ19_11425 [Planctomycetia bacterium]|nr:hypothetical protein [Planctomycetia bacterium]